MEVYEAIEGPLSAETCFLGYEVCPRGECMFGGLMEAINNLARKQLEETALSDLVNGSRRRRRDGGDRARGSRRRRKADVRRGAV
jgi:DNA-binding IscR family transcriptional regulator